MVIVVNYSVRGGGGEKRFEIVCFFKIELIGFDDRFYLWC